MPVTFVLRTIMLSSTASVSVLRVVVVPLTVRFPVTVRLLPIVTLSGRPTVTNPTVSPETSISFVVPAIAVTPEFVIIVTVDASPPERSNRNSSTC